MEELRKIKGEVKNTAKCKILEAEVCYRIRKLRLNRQSGKKRKQARSKGTKESAQNKSY